MRVRPDIVLGIKPKKDLAEAEADLAVRFILVRIALGNPLKIIVTEGNASDISCASALINGYEYK